jgi:hypothetical protein
MLHLRPATERRIGLLALPGDTGTNSPPPGIFIEALAKTLRGAFARSPGILHPRETKLVSRQPAASDDAALLLAA